MKRYEKEICIEVSDCSDNESSLEIDRLQPDNDTLVDTHVDKDVDGGWAWVVLAGATATFFVFGATMKGFGVFFNGFIEKFDASSSITSLISGILHATYSVFTLPVLTIGLKYFTTRQFVIMTSLLSSAAFICGSFATRIEILLLTNGIMGGLAFTCSHGPLMYLTGVYFVERRSLSQAVAVSGFTFGGLIFPPIYGYLIDNYGINGGMLITGGIQLNIIVFAIVMRPKRPFQHYSKKQGTKLRNEMLNGLSDGNPKQNDMDTLQILTNPNMKYIKPKSFHSRRRSISEPHIINKLGLNQSSEHPIISSHRHIALPEHHGSFTKIINSVSHSSVTHVISEFDIISASIWELPMDKIKSTETIDTVSEEKEAHCATRFIDCGLFKEPFMWIYAIAYCFGRVPAAFLSIFIAPLAKEANVSASEVVTLVSLVNACDFVGMVLSGVISDRKILRNYTTVIVSLCVTAICLALSPLCTEFWHFILFSVMTGIGAGGIFALTPSIVVDFLGLEKFRSAMGILVLLQGVSLGLSAPFMGLLRDITGTYTTSFFFMSGCDGIAALILICGLLGIKHCKT